jgi:sRNA-binding carbon storage regulator CsrA
VGLTLARRPGERIVITSSRGERLFVTLVEIRGMGQVALDFDGPKHEFTVHREEVQQRHDRGDVRPARRGH